MKQQQLVMFAIVLFAPGEPSVQDCWFGLIQEGVQRQRFFFMLISKGGSSVQGFALLF